jgi:hypothetical protein
MVDGQRAIGHTEFRMEKGEARGPKTVLAATAGHEGGKEVTRIDKAVHGHEE